MSEKTKIDFADFYQRSCIYIIEWSEVGEGWIHPHEQWRRMQCTRQQVHCTRDRLLYIIELAISLFKHSLSPILYSFDFEVATWQQRSLLLLWLLLYDVIILVVVHHSVATVSYHSALEYNDTLNKNNSNIITDYLWSTTGGKPVHQAKSSERTIQRRWKVVSRVETYQLIVKYTAS